MFVKRLVLLLSLLCFLGQSGLCLLGLQLVGWSRMVAQLSEFVPVDRAVAIVLSGEEMCGICDFVEVQQSLDDTVTLVVERLASPLVWQDISTEVSVSPRLWVSRCLWPEWGLRAQWRSSCLEEPPRWV